MVNKYGILKEEYNIAQEKKDVSDLMLDQIDFHGMIAEQLSEENGILK